MLNPILFCKKPTVVVPTTRPLPTLINRNNLQPEAVLDERTSRNTNCTSMTTKPERNRGKDFITIMRVHGKRRTDASSFQKTCLIVAHVNHRMVTDKVSCIPEFDALQIAHKISVLCVLNVNSNVTILQN